MVAGGPALDLGPWPSWRQRWPHPPPLDDPLAVPRGLTEAAELGAWLSMTELARLLGVAPGTVRGWGSGHRPGFQVERRKDGAALWWRVTAASD